MGDQLVLGRPTYSLCSHNVVFSQGILMATGPKMDTAYSTRSEHDVEELDARVRRSRAPMSKTTHQSKHHEAVIPTEGLDDTQSHIASQHDRHKGHGDKGRTYCEQLGPAIVDHDDSASTSSNSVSERTRRTTIDPRVFPKSGRTTVGNSQIPKAREPSKAWHGQSTSSLRESRLHGCSPWAQGA